MHSDVGRNSGSLSNAGLQAANGAFISIYIKGMQGPGRPMRFIMTTLTDVYIYGAHLLEVSLEFCRRNMIYLCCTVSRPSRCVCYMIISVLI